MEPRPIAIAATLAAVPYATVEAALGSPLAGAVATLLLAVSALVWEHVHRLRHERREREVETAVPAEEDP